MTKFKNYFCHMQKKYHPYRLSFKLTSHAVRQNVITRASFCCNKIVRKLHLFLTEVAVKSCIYAQAF